MQFSDLREFNNDCSIILQGIGANVKLFEGTLTKFY